VFFFYSSREYILECQGFFNFNSCDSPHRRLHSQLPLHYLQRPWLQSEGKAYRVCGQCCSTNDLKSCEWNNDTIFLDACDSFILKSVSRQTTLAWCVMTNQAAMQRIMRWWKFLAPPNIQAKCLHHLNRCDSHRKLNINLQHVRMNMYQQTTWKTDMPCTSWLMPLKKNLAQNPQDFLPNWNMKLLRKIDRREDVSPSCVQGMYTRTNNMYTACNSEALHSTSRWFHAIVYISAI